MNEPHQRPFHQQFVVQFDCDNEPSSREIDHLKASLEEAVGRSRNEGQLTPDDDACELRVGRVHISAVAQRRRPDLKGKSYHLLVKAYACGEVDEAPASAYRLVDQAFIDRLYALADVVTQQDLAYAEVWNYPHWQGDHRTDTDRLCVSENGFFWRAYLKYVDTAIETTQVEFSRLEQALQEAEAGSKSVLLFEIDMDDYPEACDPIGCRQVEWSPQFAGADFHGVGQKAYIPMTLVAQHGDSLEAAFTAHTGADAIHIIHVAEDETYTPDGERIAG